MSRLIDVTLKCTDFPGIAFQGKQPVFVGVQRGKEVVDTVAGDSVSAVFAVPVTVRADKDGAPDFFGPAVHGARGSRFLYLVWFVNDETRERIGRAKVRLNHLAWQILEGASVEAHVLMTDHKGGPTCATVKGDLITWNSG